MGIGHFRCRYPSVVKVFMIAVPASSTVDGSSSISSFHSNSRFSIASSMVDLTSIRLLAQINKSFCFVGLNVVLENQIRVALAKFLERPPLTLGRVAVKTKPVIEYQN